MVSQAGKCLNGPHISSINDSGHFAIHNSAVGDLAFFGCRTLRRPIAAPCEGLSQHPAKAYRSTLRRLIAAPCEGRSQHPAKAYRSTLRRLSGGYAAGREAGPLVAWAPVHLLLAIAFEPAAVKYGCGSTPACYCFVNSIPSIVNLFPDNVPVLVPVSPSSPSGKVKVTVLPEIEYVPFCVMESVPAVIFKVKLGLSNVRT